MLLFNTSSLAADTVPSGAGTHATSGISEASFGTTIAALAAGVASGGASSGTHAASDCTYYNLYLWKIAVFNVFKLYLCRCTHNK